MAPVRFALFIDEILKRSLYLFEVELLTKSDPDSLRSQDLDKSLNRVVCFNKVKIRHLNVAQFARVEHLLN